MARRRLALLIAFGAAVGVAAPAVAQDLPDAQMVEDAGHDGDATPPSDVDAAACTCRHAARGIDDRGLALAIALIFGIAFRRSQSLV